MKNIFYLTILFISSFLFSCESLIDVKSPDDQLNTQDVFTDVNTVRGALATLYINVRQSSLLNGSYTGLGTIMGMHTDDLEPYGNTSIAAANLDIYNGNIVATNTAVANLWNSTYFHIYAINSFIDGLSKSNNIEEQEKKIISSEARFLRALYYQFLTQIFGDIPYTTFTDYNYNKSLKKTEQSQLYLLIEKELLESIDNIPVTYRNKERIFPNRSTLELLLAKNYLLQRKYTEAVFYAEKVLSNVDYALESSPDKVFKKDAKSTIWQVSPSEVNVATLEAANYYFSNKPVTSYLSSSLINSFEENDLRKQFWIRKVKDNNTEWYHSYKYKNVNNNTDEYSVLFRVEEAMVNFPICQTN